jgi:hypothetical protein
VGIEENTSVLQLGFVVEQKGTQMPKSRKAISVLVAATALASSLLFSIMTPASSHFAPSSLSLHVSDKSVRPHQRIVFFGRLRQVHRRCRRGARIQLVRRGKGVVRTDRTDREGEFRLPIDPKPNHGRYFARYRGSGRFGYGYGYGYGATHRCGGARSRRIRIHLARR